MPNRPSARPMLVAIPVLLSLACVARAQYVGTPASPPDSYGATPNPAANPVTLVDLSEPQVITYTVAKGDSLTKIAQIGRAHV